MVLLAKLWSRVELSASAEFVRALVRCERRAALT